MSDMLLEVEDALRAERLKAFWQRYGQWLTMLAVLAVLLTAVGSFWFNRTNARLEAQTDQLFQTLQDGAEPAQQLATLQKLAKETQLPLKAIVLFQSAQKQEQMQKAADARNSYRSIASMTRLPAVMRDLAALQGVRLGMLGDEKSARLLRELQPIASATSPFRASALELKGLLLVKEGKIAEANKIFNNLSTDVTVPGSLRERAKAYIRPEGQDAK